MEDNRIIDLYWAREEQALTETERKYGSYCRSIAFNILHSHEDTEECVSDTWLRTWNAIPPARPGVSHTPAHSVWNHTLTVPHLFTKCV